MWAVQAVVHRHRGAHGREAQEDGLRTGTTSAHRRANAAADMFAVALEALSDVAVAQPQLLSTVTVAGF